MICAGVKLQGLGERSFRKFWRTDFPNISTGIYNCPKSEACAVAVQAVRDFVAENEGLEEIQFVCLDEENYRLDTAVVTIQPL